VIDEALKSPFSSFFEKGLLLFGAVLEIFWVRFCEVLKKMARRKWRLLFLSVAKRTMKL
jgi:hypothetical protein